MIIWGLERWLSCQEPVLLLQRTQFSPGTHVRWVIVEQQLNNHCLLFQLQSIQNLLLASGGSHTHVYILTLRHIRI